MKKAIILAFSFFLCSVAGAKPLIGISSSASKSTSASASSTYIMSVYKAGGIPVVLPYAVDDEMARTLISELDGVIFTGGEDVSPSLYGEEVWNETVKCNPQRDSSDIRLILAAYDAGKPILGICRGHQIVNVVLGGKLIQDIPTQVENCLIHKQTESHHLPSQTIGILPDSRLSRLLGGVSSIAVNSLHHESVKVPGKGLRVVAATSDRVVEACESTGTRYIVTMQFHPEKMIYKSDYTFLPVFEDFVEECGKGKSNGE